MTSTPGYGKTLIASRLQLLSAGPETGQSQNSSLETCISEEELEVLAH
jgi:hypothetical protein